MGDRMVGQLLAQGDTTTSVLTKSSYRLRSPYLLTSYLQFPESVSTAKVIS